MLNTAQLAILLSSATGQPSIKSFATETEWEHFMNGQKRRVCIVGAGAGGITAAKHLLEEGFSVELFEKRDGIGGLWYVGEGVPSFALNMTATSSRSFLAFSDFPFPKNTPQFPHSTEYIQYLLSYADTFGVTPHIRLEHEVLSVREREQGWDVTVRHRGLEQTHHYDNVVVCSGLHHVPLIPEIPGMREYQGEAVHSSFVKKVDHLKGKRVMVVGGGESASDYAHDLADVAAETFMSLRRGIAVTRHRGLRGLPGDLDSTRAKVWLPRAYLHDFNVDCRLEERHSAFKTFYTVVGLPFLLGLLLIAPDRALPLLKSLLHPDSWISLFRAKPRHGPASGIELSRAVNEVTQQMPATTQAADALATRIKYLFDWYSGAGHNSQPFTKHDEFLLDIAQQKVRVVPAIKRFVGGKQLELEDGRIVEIDSIIYCSGFQSHLPFLEQKDLDGRELYKNVFYPKNMSLSFVGLVRPNVGALPPVAEMQSRWLAGVLAGRILLPSQQRLMDEIQIAARQYTESRPHHHRRITSLVDYHLYMEELAGIIGARPHLLQLLTSPKIFFTFLFGPMGCFQYRLHGHGANPKAVHETVENLPPIPLERVVQHGILVLLVKPCFSLLAMIGFRKFQPQC